MQVVILAAGRGERMKTLTRDTPKPMLKVKGKSILEHKIDILPKKIKEVILIVGYRAENIINHFKRFYNGRRITYVYQHKFNGTGGALHLAKSILRDKFLVLYGDDLYHKKDLKDLVDHELAILGYEVEDPSLYGVIKTNRKGNMVGIIEKPKKSKDKFVNTGAYILNKKIFDYEMVPSTCGEYYLTDVLTEMAGEHKIKVVRARAWHPIGNPDDLIKAEEIIDTFL